MGTRGICGCLVYILLAAVATAADGNRLTYLDSDTPYYPHRDFPKLTTPQWVGEEGIEAVVILAIDDMRDPQKYEQYLRPILQRLKQIDGRAPVSIMTNNVKPDDPLLQQWLGEGLSLECHTADHPCPLLHGGDFDKAKSTYDRCIDLMHEIPGNKPVAFRMPCCDSLNTVSPRFFAEIFNKTTPSGKYLSIDSSVFNVFTADDPEIPRELITDPDGREKFRKYLPKGLVRKGATFNTFVNTIENYPYPYVINRLCWEFPCVAPSDWSAQHLHGPNNPDTVRDWKAALDITVLKQGVFCLVFHPHGWIKSEQIVELIDHAVETHGKKVKFLTFREALERLNRNLLAGHPLREEGGQDAGVRILDLNNDGYLDVVAEREIGDSRMWDRSTSAWLQIKDEYPAPSARFGVFDADGAATRLHSWSFGLDGDLALGIARPNASKVAAQAEWRRVRDSEWVLAGAQVLPFSTRSIHLRDINGDGQCEMIVADASRRKVYRLDPKQAATSADGFGKWMSLPFSLPEGVLNVDGKGRDAGLRFVDLDEDGHDDVVFSNAERYGIWLFKDMQSGWSIEVLSGKRGERDPKDELPAIVRADGSNNGFFVHSRHLFWQNEDTDTLPDLVDRRSFDDLLKDVQPGPKSPEMSLRSMQPRPGFDIELVATEPLTMDPVAFDWGPDGKLWIAEMADYPLGVPAEGERGRQGEGETQTEHSPTLPLSQSPPLNPGGRIRYLEDADGDGKYDKSTLFLDGVPFPTGVKAWRNGVLVTAAPDIFYAEDTNGDGRADHREVLYTGFGEGNQQHRVNGFEWGLDGWLYCANGDSGGTIRSLKTGDEVEIRGRDLRIHPDTGRIEAVTGQTQFGRARDDWGTWFGCNNSNPMYHFVLDDRYLRRNPHLAAPRPVVQVSETPGAAPVFPISRPLPRFNDFDRLNRFTSACSAIIYRDELFGPEFAGNSFVSEPVHNLVHREIVSPKGITFTSRRADDERESEFLASRDNWFRPTMIRTGPDGALWIADMYRHVIEHPEWIPQEWQDRLDLRAGEDRGRIYRVFPKSAKLRPIPRLDDLSTEQLVAALDYANGWQRDTAQQLLLERRDPAAVTHLESLLRESRRPEARLHALCTLASLDALSDDILLLALADDHPGVRRRAVKQPGCFGAAGLLDLVNDRDPHVRLQLAYSLGDWNDPRAADALAALALNHADDPFFTAAALSSVNEENVQSVVLAVLKKQSGGAHPQLIEKLVGLAGAMVDSEVLVPILAAVCEPANAAYSSWQFTALAGLLEALDRRSSDLKSVCRDDQQALAAVERVIDAAAAIAATDTDNTQRLAAIRLLGAAPGGDAEKLSRLRSLLEPRESPPIQQAAIAALGRSADPAAAEAILSGWKGYGPALRAEVLDLILSRNAWIDRLLEAIESGQIQPAELDAARQQRLLSHNNASIRQRAEKLLADSISADRQRILDEYRSATELAGDPARGREVFAKACATCHRLDGIGHEVGPDLAALTDKSPASMLVAILDPNRSLEAKFVNYLAVTTQGQTFNGMLANEAGSSITLVGPEAKQVQLLRSEIEELTSTAKSLMPEGLEKDLSPQDVANLIAWLRGSAPARSPKSFAGNAPAVIQPEKNGSFRLTPASCEIYGPQLVLEDKYENLGYWMSLDDEAVWTLDVPADGHYVVRIEWACPPETAGNTAIMECGGNRMTFTVHATGSWDAYWEARVGEIELPQGRQRLSFRAAEPLHGALMDLKSIRLLRR